MAIAGKVAITPKGEWNANTAYTKLDLVFYENASYVATKPSTSVEPTNTSYWMLVVQSAGGADLEAIISGDTQVGNAKTLDGHEAEYFLSKSGGTIESTESRPLKIKRTSADRNVTIQFLGASGVLGYLGFLSTDDPIYIPSSGSGSKTLLHTGNKPTGTYTGNGSATARTITTGGIGTVCIVQNIHGTAIVAKDGASVFLADGSVKRLGEAYAKFYNGNLGIATGEPTLNGSATETTYSVL